MGAGIAGVFLSAGFHVEVIERDDAIGFGWDRIAGILARQLNLLRINQTQHDESLSRLHMSTSWDELSSCDFIIEAAFKDMAVKREIFAKLGAIAPSGAILTTNTSFLDVNEISPASGRPDDVLGMHFFAPASRMRLVELAAAQRRAVRIIASTFALAKKLGKLPIVCNASGGFVGNRILNAYRTLAEPLLEDGALPQHVDAALEAFGFPMGVFAVSDLAGRDIGLARRKYLAPRRNSQARYSSTIADRLCNLGRFGQKTGAGWYRYVNGKRQVDPLVTQIVSEVSKRHPVTRKSIDEFTMQRQLRAAMVNEGPKSYRSGSCRGRSISI